MSVAPSSPERRCSTSRITTAPTSTSRAPDDSGGRRSSASTCPLDVDAVVLRYVEDGEARGVEAEPEGDGWWVARFPVETRSFRYRWLLSGGEIGYAWLNGLGLVDHDIPDADDFVFYDRPRRP